MRKLNFFSTDGYNKTLRFGSSSASVATKRNAVYDQVMVNFNNVRDRIKELGLFSTAGMDLQGSQLGVTLKEASVKAYLNSFAGYISIERPLSQMRELIVYKDMITKGDGRVVLPMLGKQEPRGTSEQTKVQLPIAAAATTIELGTSVIPGSLAISLTNDGTTTVIVDDRKGFLLAQGGVLASGTIDYVTGQLGFELSAAPVDATANINYAKDGTTADSDNRIKPRQNYFPIQAVINKFEYEFDIIMDAITNKTLGSSMAADMQQAVTDEHRMAINDRLVEAIHNNYAGTTLTMDLSTYSVQAGLFESLIRTFTSGLVSVDSAIAAHCYKVVAATAYVVGNGLGDLFQSMDEAAQGWVPNNSGFVNGLLGFYKGRAVLRHLTLDNFEGYAIHKTADGELAPTALGILLPATDLPMIGNFLNTNEVAGGIYSVEGADLITNDLVQRFVVTMPDDWNVVA